MISDSPGASFQGLGVLSGYSASKAFSMSADGQVVVGASYSDSDTAQACRWTARTGMVGLGTLKQYPYGEAYATSFDGSVVGGTCNFTDLYVAFEWSQAEGIHGVPSADPNLSANTVQGMSADGTLLVGIAGGGFSPQAFLWRSPNKLKGLGFLTSVKSSAALAVSSDGSVVAGQSANDKGIPIAIRWTAATGMVALPLLAGSVGSEAFGISGNGKVIVGSSSITRENYQATLWGSAGPVSLGDLPGGTQACAAYAASNDGSVVVGFATTIDGEEAFWWDAQNGMQSLRGVLVKYGLKDQLLGWRLNRASAISLDGSAIAGYGTNPEGLTEAFLAVLG